MTKEQVKYYIDNTNTIFNEINQRVENIPEEERDILDDFSTENIAEIYNIYLKYATDILEKYNLDLNNFKALFAIFSQDKDVREEVLGLEGSNQLIRDIIDIYGEESYELLGCNSYDFEMSDIQGILDTKDNQRYEEFYTKLLAQKCEQARNLEELSNILLSTKPQYINQELIERFLSNSDRIVFSTEVRDFIQSAPTLAISGETLKMLVDRMDGNILPNDKVILERIPQELYDEEFVRILMEKSSEYVLSDVFELIPVQFRSREMWELAISKDKTIIYSLPDKKIDSQMIDEEYQAWCDGLIIDAIRENPEFVKTMMFTLGDSHKTIRVCEEVAQLSQIEENSFEVENLLHTIPEDKRTRRLYEMLLDKSARTISQIPSESFEEGLSQEEYENWLDGIIREKIAKSNDFDLLHSSISRDKRTENIWNALVDKCIQQSADRGKVSLSTVPVYNITREMCERALTDVSMIEIRDIPSVDRRLDTIQSKRKREEYEKWLSSLTEEQKDEYRQWYEGRITTWMKEHHKDGGINIFAGRLFENANEVKISPEAITPNIIKTYLDLIGPTGIEHIPAPNELTNYNEQYEDILIYAINMLEPKDYTGEKVNLLESWDILSEVPEEYITDRVVLEAIKKHPRYLDYADIEKEKFDELLAIAYKGKLESLGRTELSKQEIELMKKFAKNNAELFSTLNLEILSPDIVSSIGVGSIEKIARYSGSQYTIIDLAKDKDALVTFGFALENLKEDNIFIEPLIEKLSSSIRSEEKIIYDPATKGYIGQPSEFLQLAASRIKDTSSELTEEEKTVISYLALTPQEAKKIKSYEDILNFVENKNMELDRAISSEDITLVEAKNAYFERVVGLDYASVLELVNTYGNDTEELLASYEGRQLDTSKEIAEKASLETILKLKALIDEGDLSKIQAAYQQAIASEDKTQSFKRYKQATLLETNLRRAYGRDIVQTLNNHDRENNVETVERTEDGQEYVVRKINGPFSRMISVMGAYRANTVEGDMYDRWNTNEMAKNHALCYSYITEANPGSALLGDKKGIIISIDSFSEESVTAAAPYDLCSDFRDSSTTYTGRPQKFYTSANLPDQTRGRYSEVDIEIQDVSEGTEEYKKIQPASIICFEEIDEESIQAAIELSKKLGRTIPIELIDRRELAAEEKIQIEELLEEFKSGETLQPELVRQIITKFNNVRNAHMDSSLSDELLGEKEGKENPDAMFNKSHLNQMLLECIELAEQRINSGNVQEGLETIKQIKQFIQEEREKNVLMPSIHEKQLMSGIDLSIDYRIDEIERTYEEKQIGETTRCESIDILETSENLTSVTFESLHGQNITLPEQLSITDLQQSIDIEEIQKGITDVQRKGYYSENKKYSPEHVARVMIFSSAIATLEGADNDTKRLLLETAKYYSCGRQLDAAEAHEAYSAKIAGEELEGNYSSSDIGIIQAAIELQNFNSKAKTITETEQERKEKLTQLCSKYKIPEDQISKVDSIARYIKDAVELDKTRFVKKAGYNPPEEAFSKDALKTDSAKKLIGVSYGIQDRLSEKRLQKMSKVATINFEEQKEKIMKKFFTEILFGGEKRICNESIIESPIVREEYLRSVFKEIDFDSLMEELVIQRQTSREGELPIASTCIEAAKRIAEERIARNVTRTSKEVRNGYIEMENPTQDRGNGKEEI